MKRSRASQGGLSSERRGKRTGICIPSKTELVTLEWSWRLRQLRVPRGSEFFFERSPRPIDAVRESLVEEALERDMDFIFFLDHDVLAPPDTVLKLMEYRTPIASGQYPDKGGRGIAWKDGKPIWIEDDKATHVDEVGLGCCLIDSRVFERLSKPWFKYKHRRRDDNKPSEDVMFCRKVNEELDIKVLLVGEIKALHVWTGAIKDPETVVHLSL